MKLNIMNRKKIILMSFFTMFLCSVSSALYYFFERPNRIETNKFNKEWAINSIKNRQVLLKIKETYIFNGKEINITNFYNSYFYNECSLFLNIEIFNEKIANSKLISRDMYFCSYDESINKNINDINWIEFKCLKENQFILDNTQLIFSNINKKYKISTIPVQLKTFFRNDNNYNYIYSSFYVENDIVKFDFNKVTFKKKNNEKYDTYYNINNKNIKISLSKTFKINSSVFIRREGSLSSIIFDPNGTIIGFQSNQNKENDVIFSEVNFE